MFSDEQFDHIFIQNTHICLINTYWPFKETSCKMHPLPKDWKDSTHKFKSHKFKKTFKFHCGQRKCVLCNRKGLGNEVVHTCFSLSWSRSNWSIACNILEASLLASFSSPLWILLSSLISSFLQNRESKRNVLLHYKQILSFISTVMVKLLSSCPYLCKKKTIVIVFYFHFFP